MELESDNSDFEDEEEINNTNTTSTSMNFTMKCDSNIFTPLIEIEISENADEFNKKIFSETKKIHTYLTQSIHTFEKIFPENNSTSFKKFLNYLKKREIPNKCVCAGVIDTIPGWQCVECSTYENSIYCFDCYKASKDLHKNHKVLFLYSSGGMCDCGDPDSLKTFCPNHTGPFKNKEEIQNFISKSFTENEIKNLKIFFDEFFYIFSRYFFLLEDYDLFYTEKFNEKFNNNKNNIERDDIKNIKNNFCIVFQNFLNFLRLISNSNIGLLHFLANYFLKNNLYINSNNEKEDEEFYTKHKCYTVEKDEIKIINNLNTKHKCECPFMRLFMTNYREEIKSKDNKNEEFLLSFPHNLPLKHCFCISFFVLNEQILLNHNTDLIFNRNQFYTEDTIELMAIKTNLIEDTYEIFYNYLKNVFISDKYKDSEGNIMTYKLKSLIFRIEALEVDTKYYSKPKIIDIFSKKTFIIKKIIDIICLIHNGIKFKSIYPHPIYHDRKGYSETFFNLENYLINILEDINMYFNWNEIEYSKEVFKYLINKIIKEEKEGIIQLEENEFSFHICLYRTFGLLINYFCFNYSIQNNCNLIEAVDFFKKNFFESNEELEILVEKILKNYFKLFGFIGAVNNNFFNYYEMMQGYFYKYIHGNNFIKLDFCTIKYLLTLTDKKFDLIHYLKISNIEKVFPIFSNLFMGEKNIDINLDQLEKEIFQYESDKNDYIMQLIFLLEIIITFMKDDSCLYFCLIKQYDEILSSQTKENMFNIIKQNKYIYYDLKNILIEKIICKIIAFGNLADLKMLKKNLDNNLINIFDEKNNFEKILEELTESKMKGEKKKIFYLKDKYLYNIDFNFYINPNDKSCAQRYILNFKEDEIKLYNKYIYNTSKLTFDFYENIYNKILLNKENLILFKKIIEILNESNNDLFLINRKSLRNSILPIILNFLSNFFIINTKAFISFKIENEQIINEIKNLLLNALEKNKNNFLFEKYLEDNIKALLVEINYYKIIHNDIKGDLSKLNENDFYINYIREIKKEKKVQNLLNESDINNNQKIRTQKLKEKFKLKMNNNSKKFMDNISSNNNTENTLKEEIENENEMMCFYCRNKIELNTWKKPYGKIGLFIEDYFYSNSIKASLRNEIYNINNKNNIKNKINYEKYFWENNISDKKGRIVSCGHYFHYDCINNIYYNNSFSCPLCLKVQNTIIPPLNLLKNNNELDFINGEKIEILEKEEQDDIINLKQNEYFTTLYKCIFEFLYKINLTNLAQNTGIFDILFEAYEVHFNFLENIFYSEGSTFNKKQQIDNLQNIILSLRYIIKFYQINNSEFINLIKNNLSLLMTSSNEIDIIKNCQDMFYVNLLNKILFSLSILFDYEEIKKTFLYLLYIFLPYFAFGNFLKYIIINEIDINDINKDNCMKYIIDNNEEMVKIFEIFLQKLIFIKLITDFNNKNDNNIDILKSFNELSIEQMLSFLDINNLFILLNKGKEGINFLDIFIYIPKLFNSNDILFKQYKNNLINDIFNIIILNIKNNENKAFFLTKELIINFNPIKFDFIKFDEKAFDWIEKNLEQKCKFCSKTSKYNYICLICGNKVCHTIDCNKFPKHAELCNVNHSIFIDMDNTKICASFQFRYMKYIFPLYINENGIGPNGSEMENEFNLSHENLKSAIKNFVSYDLFFK